jgi:hypothetical protein
MTMMTLMKTTVSFPRVTSANAPAANHEER